MTGKEREKKGTKVHFEVIFRHLSGETEEIHGDPQSYFLVCQAF